MALDDAARRYLASQTRGRLATIGSDGVPQNKPAGFTYNAELGTIDIAGFNMDTSAKYQNVGINPNVAFVVDEAVSEGAAGMRFVEVRGRAERLSVEPPPAGGLSPHIIRIHPRRRVALDDEGQPVEPTSEVAGAFSEMALYVLVRRDRTWWVAAGQNTLIRPGPPESQAHVDGARDG